MILYNMVKYKLKFAGNRRINLAFGCHAGGEMTIKPKYSSLVNVGKNLRQNFFTITVEQVNVGTVGKYPSSAHEQIVV